MIGKSGERGSEISVLPARHDDDDDDSPYEFFLTSPAVFRMSDRLTWVAFVRSGRWPHSCCFVGCCFQDLFNTARSIFV